MTATLAPETYELIAQEGVRRRMRKERRSDKDTVTSGGGMSMFDKREKGEEAKYARNEELSFNINARREASWPVGRGQDVGLSCAVISLARVP